MARGEKRRTAFAPDCAGQFFDQVRFGRAGWLVFGNHRRQQVTELGAIFMSQDGVPAQQSMLECVEPS